MDWFAFLEDFVDILNAIFAIPLISVYVRGSLLSITLGSLLFSVLMIWVILYYFIPRR